jgi:hypothetical protein
VAGGIGATIGLDRDRVLLFMGFSILSGVAASRVSNEATARGSHATAFSSGDCRLDACGSSSIIRDIRFFLCLGEDECISVESCSAAAVASLCLVVCGEVCADDGADEGGDASFLSSCLSNAVTTSATSMR